MTWEYRIEKRIIGAEYAEALFEFLNRLGNDGWGLSTVYESTAHRQAPVMVYIFQREVRGDAYGMGPK